jgi:hypothetical protein
MGGGEIKGGRGESGVLGLEIHWFDGRSLLSMV